MSDKGDSSDRFNRRGARNITRGESKRWGCQDARRVNGTWSSQTVTQSQLHCWNPTITKFSLNRIFVFIYVFSDELSDILRWEDKKLHVIQRNFLLTPHWSPYQFIMHFRTQIQVLTLGILVLFTTHTAAIFPCSTVVQCRDYCLPAIGTKCVGQSYQYFLRPRFLWGSSNVVLF